MLEIFSGGRELKVDGDGSQVIVDRLKTNQLEQRNVWRNSGRHLGS